MDSSYCTKKIDWATDCLDLILLKKFDSKKQKKFFAHKWPITNDRRLVNDFLHPEFSWIGGFSAES